MALPAGSYETAWPPKADVPLFNRMGQWSAWWANDLQQLQASYGGGDIQDSTGAFASDKGGFKATVGRTLQRWFVGEATRGPDRINKIPVGLGSALCQAGADLLFAEQVKVGSPHEATKARLAEMLTDTEHSVFAQAAEEAGALGGVFLRATWHVQAFPDGPFTTVKSADSAVPEFLFGRLRAVTFWAVLERDPNTGKVLRLLERHELDPVTGNGLILFGLYQGTDSALGVRLSLADSSHTIGMLSNPDLEQELLIDTRSPGLAVTYVANQRPNRLWRTHATGRYLGRSDLDGVEHLLDQLSEVVSAWVRAIRLAKARIFIAKQLLKSGGPGNGQIADLEQEAFTQVDSLGGADLGLDQQVHMVEPRVNFEQYAATAKQLTDLIIQVAGYSATTFGEGEPGGSSRTATEIEQKERRSLLTRERKIREWRPALEAHLRKLLAIDAALFGGKGNPLADLDIDFADGVQESQLHLAQTVLALFTGQSASTKERVRIVHPGWEDEQIEAEAALIDDEFKPEPLPDPGMGPFGEDPGAQQPDAPVTPIGGGKQQPAAA